MSVSFIIAGWGENASRAGGDFALQYHEWPLGKTESKAEWRPHVQL